MIQLIKTASYTPDKVMTNYDYEKILDTSHEWIVERTGIYERRIATTEDTSNLAIKTVEKLDLTGEEKAQIKAIFVATSTPDYNFPSIAAMIHEKFGFSEDLFSMDFNVACSGFVSGLVLLERYLKPGERAILVGAEVLTKIVDKKDRSTAVLFGDGAGACLLEKTEDPFYYDVGTRGDFEKLYAKVDTSEEKEGLQMMGKDVFRFAVDALPKSINRLMVKGGLSPEDIDHYIFHQANKRIIDYVEKKMKLDEKKIYLNLDRYGNTSAASVPLILDELWQQGKILSRQKLLLSGFGAGLSWATALIVMK